MFHHLTAEARKGYGSIISWVFLACLISCGQEQPVGGGGDQPQLLTNRLVRCLCQLPCVTCNRALSGISNISRKHFNILHPSHHCKDVFKQPPFVAYRRSPNLRDLLVKAQLPVIYIIQCNCCNFQYIGETKRRLKDRFNEHRHSVDKN